MQGDICLASVMPDYTQAWVWGGGLMCQHMGGGPDRGWTASRHRSTTHGRVTVLCRSSSEKLSAGGEQVSVYCCVVARRCIVYLPSVRPNIRGWGNIEVLHERGSGLPGAGSIDARR